MGTEESLKTINVAIKAIEKGYNKLNSHDLLSINVRTFNEVDQGKKPVKTQLASALREVRTCLEQIKK